ncbi:MAG: hypothetical protein ABII22_04585 [Candidatus Micrarchaeota archaeon]
MKQKQKVEYELKQIGSAEIVNKAREGRFQVTVMKMNMVKLPADESMRDFIPEISFNRIRTCIQYSTYSKHKDTWNNQQIWCNKSDELIELRDLLNEIIDGASEEEASSSFEGEQDE